MRSRHSQIHLFIRSREKISCLSLSLIIRCVNLPAELATKTPFHACPPLCVDEPSRLSRAHDASLSTTAHLMQSGVSSLESLIHFHSSSGNTAGRLSQARCSTDRSAARRRPAARKHTVGSASSFAHSNARVLDVSSPRASSMCRCVCACKMLVRPYVLWSSTQLDPDTIVQSSGRRRRARHMPAHFYTAATLRFFFTAHSR